MKIGIIGLGDIAKKAYLPIITRKKSLDLYFYTRNKKKLKELCDEYKVIGVSKVEEMIDKKIEAVFVHSSTESHYEIVKYLLENNIHVYVDKPISYYYEEAKELTRLAKEKKLVLMVGFNRRNSPYIRDLKGNINSIIMEKNRVNLPGEKRVFVYDDFIHVVDTVIYLLGSYKKVEVNSQVEDGLVNNLVVNFYGEKNIGIGIMNRISGMTEERVEVFKKGEKTIVENVSFRYVYNNNTCIKVKDSDWIPTLKKRGFYFLIDQFVNYINKEKKFDLYHDQLLTHKVCEEIVSKIK